MADVVHRLSELTHTRLSWLGCSDDDSSNRLNHRHTVLMLLVFSAVLTSRLFISDLIICWTPGEFTGTNTRHSFSLVMRIRATGQSTRVPVDQHHD